MNKQTANIDRHLVTRAMENGRRHPISNNRYEACQCKDLSRVIRLLFGKKQLVTNCGCKVPILFDLDSYYDVRVQSNPFMLKGDKRVLVERAW